MTHGLAKDSQMTESQATTWRVMCEIREQMMKQMKQVDWDGVGERYNAIFKKKRTRRKAYWPLSTVHETELE